MNKGVQKMRNEPEYAKILESTGLSRENAEKYLRVVEGAVLDNAATKQDIDQLKISVNEGKIELNKSISEVRAELKKDINLVKIDFSNLRGEFLALEHRLVNKMGKIVVTAIGTSTLVMTGVAALFKFAI